jgi:hypothetical protein
MANNHNNLLVLFYTGITDEQAVRVEMEHLTAIINMINLPDSFCSATELVNRNHITSNRNLMMKEAKFRRLRAFRFFINKN